jgi:hypothetical protein
MNKPLNGSGYDLNATNRGFSLDIHATQQEEGNIQPFLKLNPFDCIVEHSTEGVSNIHRLKIVKGEIPYIYSTSDNGYVESVSPYFYQLDKYNLFPTGTVTSGADANSIFIDEGGYLELSEGEDYVVFAYILGPQYAPDISDPYEFKIPQLAVSIIGDEPETDINSGTTSTRSFEINTEISGGETPSVSYIFKNAFSVRANIARIKWNSATDLFYVEQITNNPNLNYVPYIGTSVSASPTFDSTTVDSIVDGYTGYTKDLNEDAIGYDVVAQGQL